MEKSLLEENPGFFARRPGLKAALEAGEFEGIPFSVSSDQELRPGDTYLAERNTGPHLLTCRENVKDGPWIHAAERAYSYNTGECIKIDLQLD